MDGEALDAAAYLVRVHPAPLVFLEVPHGREVVVVGRRGGDAAMPLDDDRVSARHCALERTEACWQIRDLGSTNRTSVDGRPLDARPQPLMSGSTIRVGGTLLVFRTGSPPPPNDDDDDDEHLPGRSPAMSELRANVARSRPESGAVLIQGETGTGKEYVARSLHRALGRGALIAVNAAQLHGHLAGPALFGNAPRAWTGAVERKGFIPLADDGVLFLDEIGDLDAEVQPELLRFLESGTYHRVGDPGVERSSTAWVVAATHLDLRRAVVEGRFRADLLARLRKGAQTITVPPLRERREDILAWARRFVGPERRWSASFAERLVTGLWLCNLRELHEVVVAADRVARPGDVLGPPHLARSTLDPAIPVGPSSPVEERARPAPDPTAADLSRALEAADGNLTRAAEALGVSRRKMYRLLAKYGLKTPRTGGEDDDEEDR